MASSPTGPGGPPPPPLPPLGSTNLGIAPNVGGLLCYVPCCIGLVFSVVVAIVEKQSRFLRFHAFQSLLLHGAAIALGLVLSVLGAILGQISSFFALLLFPIQLVVGVGLIGMTIFLMIKAYNNEEWEIPRLGPLARTWL
ncbi:MAG TPA: DUF4870 domain-containing protein [Vicinamibacteria bacterium]|nr:DUF4870 domain-containing protein [Vicinamibacteria bacterium]